MGDDESIIDAGQERIRAIVMLLLDSVFFLGVAALALFTELGREELTHSILGERVPSWLLQAFLFVVEAGLYSLFLIGIGVWIRRDFRRFMKVGNSHAI